MKIVFASLLLISGNTFGLTCSKIGTLTHCDNGVTFRTIGNTMYDSYGNEYRIRKNGNTTHVDESHITSYVESEIDNNQPHCDQADIEAGILGC